MNICYFQIVKHVCVSLRYLQDIQVYRYYRDLINFKTRGNPGLMLRCINPQEAKLLDAASGIHIKFRLAGVGLISDFNNKQHTKLQVFQMVADPT